MARLYCAISRSTGKMYVGVTNRTVLIRWRQHLYDARRGSRFKFHCALRKYGAADFEVEELFLYTTESEAYEAEVALIAALDLFGNGYNSTLGGAGPSVKGQPKTISHRKRIAAALRGKRRPLEVREKLRIANLGKKQSEATRARRRGRTASAETKAKMSSVRKGVLKSEETRRRMTAAMYRRWAEKKDTNVLPLVDAAFVDPVFTWATTSQDNR